MQLPAGGSSTWRPDHKLSPSPGASARPAPPRPTAGVAQICKVLSEASPDFDPEQVLHALYCRLYDLAARMNANHDITGGQGKDMLRITRKPGQKQRGVDGNICSSAARLTRTPPVARRAPRPCAECFPAALRALRKDIPMKRIVIGVVLALLLCSPLPCPLSAQPDLSKVLVGKWEGEMAQPRIGKAQIDLARTLVISEVNEKAGTGSAKGEYGISGQRLAPVAITIKPSDGGTQLEFQTPAGGPVTLRLVGDKHLQGSTKPPRAPEERGLKLQKTQ